MNDGHFGYKQKLLRKTLLCNSLKLHKFIPMGHESLNYSCLKWWVKAGPGAAKKFSWLAPLGKDQL
jgi:hypothetical protein